MDLASELLRIGRMQKLLVATDGSEGASNAIDLVARIPHRSTAEVRVVHVLERGAPFFETADVDPDDLETSEEIAQEIAAQGEEIARAAAERLSATGWRTSTIIRSGSLADEIVAEADDFDADVVVLGATGLRGGAGRLGRTARRVLRRTQRAVVFARPGRSEGPLHLLLAFDGSEASKPGVEIARQLTSPGSRVTVLSAVTVATSLYGYDIAERMSATWRAYKARVEQDAERVADQLRDTGAKVETCLIDGGTDPDDEILEATQERQPDLTILGRSDKGLFGRLFFGSVTDTVSNHAPSSVWILPDVSEPS